MHVHKFAIPTEQETREGPQLVSFQIAHGNAHYALACKRSFQPRDKPKISSDALAPGRKDGSGLFGTRNLRWRRGEARDAVSASNREKI
jgi:hypothetical protein